MKTRPYSEKGLAHNIGEVLNRWEPCFPKNSTYQQFAGLNQNKACVYGCVYANFASKAS